MNRGRNRTRGGGALVVVPDTVKVVTEGDSITNGLGATGGQPGWPGKTVPILMTDLSKTYTLANIATSGHTIATINSNYATRVGAQYDPRKELNILCLMAGTNDGASTNSVAIYKNYRNVVRKARLSGYDRAIIGTLISRNNGVPPDGAFDANTLPLNVLLRTYWSSDLDADDINDWGADPMFDTALDANNVTNYADQIHPANAGYDQMAIVAASPINNVIAAPGVRTSLPATFFPMDVSSDFTLSNSDRTVNRTAAGNKETNARGAIGKSTGKWYWEMVLDVRNSASTGIFAYDFLNQYMGNRGPHNSEVSFGQSQNNANGGLWYNSVALTTQPTTQNGDIIQWCMDATNKVAWMKRSTDANWNGDAGANPATGVGGISFADLGPGPYYPQAHVRTFGGQITARFALAQTTETIPSGFLALDQ